MFEYAFGNRLRSLRKLAGHTQEQLSAKLGITPEHLSNMERGKATPSFKLIEIIAQTFSTEPANLFLFPPAQLVGSSDERDGLHACPDYRLYITDVGFWEYDAAAESFTWNDAIYQMFGVSRQSFTPEWDNFIQRIQEEDRDTFAAGWRNLLAGQEVAPFCFRVVHPSEGLRYLIAKGTQRYENGNLAGICGVAIDYTSQKNLEDALRRLQKTLGEQVQDRTRELHSTISALDEEINVRKRAEQEANELSERLSLAMKVAEIGIWEYDRSTGMLHLDEMFLRNLGFDTQNAEIPLSVFEEHLHPDDRAGHQAAREAHVSGEKELYEAIFRLGPINGGWEWYHAMGRLRPDQESKKTTVIIGTFQNITALKQAEQAKIRSEERFRNLVENIHEIFWITEPGYKMSYVSPHFEKVFQLDSELLAQNSLAFLQRVHPEDRDRLKTALDRLWQNGEVYRETYRIVLPDERIRWVKARTFPVYGEDGSIIRTVGVADDITEMVSMNSRLAQAKEDAEKASRAKSGFIANMSHEIRTPITGMLALLQLLSHTKLDEEQQEFVALARSSGASLLETINDVLDISRIEAGQIQLTNSTFSLRQIIDSIDALFQPLARQNGIALRSHCDCAIPAKLNGDPGRIKQVLFNLTGHAVKFTRQGDVTISATHHGVDDDGKHILVLEIRDTGPGTARNHLTEILENFAQINEPSYMTDIGAGLGLAIVKRLTELMDGSVDVETDPDAGTTFRMRLPLVAVQEEQPAIENARRTRGLRPLRALVAEDDSVNQAALCRMLEILGHDVISACNGSETLERLKAETIDLLMLDIRMPDLNGYEVAKCIRDGMLESVPKDLPIIAVTAFAVPEDRHRILGSGVDDLLIKPFTMDELKAILLRVSE